MKCEMMSKKLLETSLYFRWMREFQLLTQFEMLILKPFQLVLSSVKMKEILLPNQLQKAFHYQFLKKTDFQLYSQIQLQTKFYYRNLTPFRTDS